MKFSLTSFYLLFLPILISGQVIINEYSASNLDLIKDSFNKTEDWFELYNTSDASVDLSGWYLSDKEDNLEKWTIPTGVSIPSKGFLTVYCSGRGGLFNGELHANFKLTQTEGNDIIAISGPSGIIADLVTIKLTLTEHSNCREEDGSALWKVCTRPSFGVSNNNSPQFSGYTETPRMNTQAGFFNSSQVVSIESSQPDAVIRYTLDGSNPLADSPIYDSPITLDATTVIKAQVYSMDPDILPGKIEFNTYFINEEFTLPVFSVAADRVTNLANGTGEILPIGSIEYFKDGERVTTSFGELNRHGQDSWVLPHRSIDWISRDEMGYSKAVNAPIFSTSDRNEYQRFMFRNSGDDNYPAIADEAHEGSTHIRDEYVQTLAAEGKMELDVRTVERVILFLNGTYWGVYGMREKVVDHDFTSEYYDQGKLDLQFLSTWGETDIEYGGLEALSAWGDIRDFVLENDMADPDNYSRVESEINLISLIDYFAMNQASVASDWLNYNTGWWRGLNPDGAHKKWGYLLWDLDATFDYYINYTDIPNTDADASFCDIYDISEAIDEFFDQSFSLSCGDFGLENNTPYSDEDIILGLVISSFPDCCENWTDECQGYYDDPSTISTEIDFENCPSILNGSSPYPADDSIFIQVVEFDDFCCDEWDEACQEIYDVFSAGGVDIEECPIILNGTSPYPADDPVLEQVIFFESSCCDEWDGFCQQIYDFISEDFVDISDCSIIVNNSSPYSADDPKLPFVIEMNPDCCDAWGLSCERDYQLLGGDQFSEPDDPLITDLPGNLGKHEKILLKLFEESETFKQLYYSRYADLMNTVFTCENMNELLERMIAVIEPEMPRQIDRWGGSLREWNSNLDDLRNYINTRCLFMNDEAMACHNEVDGQYAITLESEPADIGKISFNTLDLEALPWSGDYFGNMDNLATASVKEEFKNIYEFSHWESKLGNNMSPSELDEMINYRLSMPDTLIAHFKLIDTGNPFGDVVINELMASNELTAADEEGEFDDWIELYNNGSSSVDLSGYYISDNEQNLTKFEIPDSMVLQADDYLILWADEDQEQGRLHTNFKLSKAGESVFLSDPRENIIDQITYSAQETDMGFARQPNGTGAFRITTPTFNANNGSGTSTSDSEEVKDVLVVYPNPALNKITIQFKKNGHLLNSVIVRDLLGKEVMLFNDLSLTEMVLDLGSLTSGFYLVTVNDSYTSKFLKS